jgi:hypothetical protein
MEHEVSDAYTEFALCVSMHDLYVIEQTVKHNSGRYSKSELAHHLPREMTWTHLSRVLRVLESQGKIAYDSKGRLLYTFS